MPKKKKNKPKPESHCRYLFRPKQTDGWVQVDPNNVKDYGEYGWEPDPEFQSKCGPYVSINPPQNNTPAPITPQVSYSYPQPSPPPRIPSFCTLVFSVPKGLEGETVKECYENWESCTPYGVGNGIVHLGIHHMDEVTRVSLLRTILKVHVLAYEGQHVLRHAKFTQEIQKIIYDQVRWITWTAPFQAWSLLSPNAKGYNPHHRWDRWFPSPSFKVESRFEDISPTSLNYVSRAFAESFQEISGWDISFTNPAVTFVVESKNGGLKILVELMNKSVPSPFTSALSTVNAASVTYTMLRLANVQFGDMLVNLSCSELDVSLEAIETFPAPAATIVLDADLEKLRSTLHQAYDFSADDVINGAVCASRQLPFRNGIVDVVIAIIRAPSSTSSSLAKTSKLLQEITRVTCLGSGRCCIMAHPDADLKRLPIINGGYWTNVDRIETEFDTCRCDLYSMTRTMCSPFAMPPKPPFESPRKRCIPPGFQVDAYQPITAPASEFSNRRFIPPGFEVEDQQPMTRPTLEAPNEMNVEESPTANPFHPFRSFGRSMASSPWTDWDGDDKDWE